MKANNALLDQPAAPMNTGNENIETCHDVLGSNPSNRPDGATRAVYPPLFARNVVIFSIMLATFLVFPRYALGSGQ